MSVKWRENWTDTRPRTIGRFRKPAEASGFRKLAILKAWSHPDLAVHDRGRVAKAIKDELAEVEESARNASPAPERNLHEIIKARSAAMAKSTVAGTTHVELRADT